LSAFYQDAANFALVELIIHLDSHIQNLRSGNRQHFFLFGNRLFGDRGHAQAIFGRHHGDQRFRRSLAEQI
jgi:hypothetical protein